MAARYFNWKLATVLAVAAGVFVVAAYVLHRWQVGTRALQALPLAEAAYAQQDYDEAALQFGNYLRVNGDDVEVLVKYADAQRKRRPGDLQYAISAYRSVLRVDSGNVQAVKGLMEMYLPYASSVGEAELVGQNFLKGHDSAEIRRLHTEALYKLGKNEQAADELREALTKHPDDVLSYEQMGTLAREHPDLVNKPAEQWLDDAVAQNPTSALAYIVRAGFYLGSNSGEKAQDAARRANAAADLERAQKCDLSDTPTRIRLIAGLTSLGMENKDANQLDRAREQLRILQEKDPTELALWRLWADLTLGLHDLALRVKDSALEAKSLEEMNQVAQTGLKALAAQPWDFLPFATELFIRSGHLEDANNCLAQMRQKGVVPPQVTAFLEGFLAEKRGQWRDAIGAWRTAVTLGYRQPIVYRKLADALSLLGDTQSAIVQLRTLVARYPARLEGHVALMELLAQTGDWPEVRDQAAQILKLSPGHGEAILLGLRARVQLLTAGVGAEAEREKAWQDVEAQVVGLEKENEGSLEIRLLHARVDLDRGKLPEVATLLADLESKYPAEIRVILLQAELCAKQDRKAEAKSRLQAAVTKFPQALEPIRSLAVFLNRQNQRAECEAVLQAGLTRLQEPRLRRDLGIVLAEFYRQWKEEDKVTKWLGDLAGQFPSDILPRHLLLTRPEIVKDPGKAQALVDEIKTLEGEAGCQWRYEQAKLWNGSGDDFKTHYPQIVKLLQENLATNPRDHASRVLLADTYEKATELPLALATYQEAQRLQPDNVLVLARTVAVLIRAKDYEGAGRLLDQADRQNLHSPDLENLRLQFDVLRGDLVAVESALEKAVNRDPNDLSSRLQLALVRIQAKKYDEAQKLLDFLKAKVPDSMEVLDAQVRLYLVQGKNEEAVRLCDQVVGKRPNASAYLLRANVHKALKQDAKALEDLGQVITLDPKKPEGWATRADFYRGIGRLPEAIADIRKALELAPDNLMVQKRAIVLFLAAQDPSLLGEADTLVDRALAPFAKAPPANTDDPRMADYTLLRMLKAQILAGKRTGPGIEGARRLLQEVVAEQPKTAEAWWWLAQLELSQEDPGKAADVALQGLIHNRDNGPLLLLKARAEKVRQPAVAALTLKGLLDQNPKNVEVLVDLADAYARAGRTQQAVDLLREKLPGFEGPARRRCEIALAEAVYASGQRDEARTLFEQLIQADPNDPTPTMSLAQQLRRERRWTEMNQLVHRWLSAHPQDADVAMTIARVLGATGDKQAFLMGADILRITLERNPRSLSTLSLLAMMMQDVGRTEESAKFNRQILEIDPKNVIALNNLAWILCEGENAPDQYQEALDLAERGIKILPDYVDLLDTRGYAFYRLGDFDKAWADFAKCLELYPANSLAAATPHFHLALTCTELKRRTEAVGHLQKALDSNRMSLRTAKEQADAGRATYAVKLLKEALHLHDQMEPLRTTLGLSDTTTVSAQELAEAKALLEQLQKGQ